MQKNRKLKIAVHGNSFFAHVDTYASQNSQEKQGVLPIVLRKMASPFHKDRANAKVIKPEHKYFLTRNGKLAL
tara:strand:- start:11466 stop:11684 length:219 start_codon:yes stop_codon:yes gene_type:complete